jgi:UDP-2,3-diacylglucosamine hydrolase
LPVTIVSTLFIADLHLSPRRPRIGERFAHFLRETVEGARALYILGDLFESWAGDDDLDDPFNAHIARLLGEAAQRLPIFLMHGNRDFLIGARFAYSTGIHLLPDPSVREVEGKPTLLMHGDTLCTDDHDYQEFRAMVRDPRWQAEFLAQPLSRRKAQIEALRARSEKEKAGKPPAIMDVNAAAVTNALREHGVKRLIHGHTHRPGHHTHEVDGRLCERWVLPDWYEAGGYLRCNPEGCQLHPLEGD